MSLDDTLNPARKTGLVPSRTSQPFLLLFFKIHRKKWPFQRLFLSRGFLLPDPGFRRLKKMAKIAIAKENSALNAM